MSDVRFDTINVVPSESPFSHCKLGRESLAPVLCQLVESMGEDGGVLAIDGKWGTGKTSFIKMWKAWLEQKEFKVLFFDAWKNDYLVDPLIGLYGELTQIKTESSIYEKTYQSAGNVAKALLPSIAKGVLGKFVGQEAAEQMVEIGTEGAKAIAEPDTFESAVESYKTLSKNLEEFKCRLESYIKEVTPEKPLVFIIDELDRCKPDFAVKLLERVKHLFCIKNIVFVLAIDKEQLANSIRGFYGSDKINAEDYLRKFIDLVFQLPQVGPLELLQLATDHFKIDTLLTKLGWWEEKENRAKLLEYTTLSLYLITRELKDIRSIEKFFSFYAIVLRLFSKEDNCSPSLVLFLVYLKMYRNDCYEKLSSLDYTVQEVVDLFESVISLDVVKTMVQNNELYDCFNDYFIDDLLAKLMRSYRPRQIYADELIRLNNDNKYDLLFKTRFENHESISNAINCCKISDIKEYINRVDLLGQLKR